MKILSLHIHSLGAKFEMRVDQFQFCFKAYFVLCTSWTLKMDKELYESAPNDLNSDFCYLE